MDALLTELPTAYEVAVGGNLVVYGLQVLGLDNVAVGRKLLHKLDILDTVGRAKRLFARVEQKVMGAPNVRAFTPEMVVHLTEMSRTVDHDALVDLWVELISRGQLGQIAEDELRWAATKLKGITGTAALCLALFQDRRLKLMRHADDSKTIRSAVLQLQDAGLIELYSQKPEGMGTLLENNTNGRIPEHRPAVLFQRLLLGEGGPENSYKQLLSIRRAWKLTDIGVKLSELSGVAPLLELPFEDELFILSGEFIEQQRGTYPTKKTEMFGWDLGSSIQISQPKPSP